MENTEENRTDGTRSWSQSPSYGTSSRTDAAAPSPPSRGGKAVSEQWAGAPTPVQFRLPADLVTSLKLLSFSTGKTMSELALEFLTTDQVVQKAWIATRKAG